MSKLAIVFSRVTLSRNTRIFGEMDPYCKIRSSIDSEQTPPHIDGGNNPDWSERTYEILYQNPSEIIIFQVWDKNETKEILVGEAKELISKLLSGKFKLNLVYNGRMAGELEVKATHSQNSENKRNLLSAVEENRSYFEESKGSVVFEENHQQDQFFKKPKNQSEFHPNNSELKSEYYYENKGPIEVEIPKHLLEPSSIYDQEDPQNNFNLSPQELKQQQDYLKACEVNKQINPVNNSNRKEKDHMLIFENDEILNCSGKQKMAALYTVIQNRPKSPIVLIRVSGESANCGKRFEHGNSWLEITVLNGSGKPISEEFTVYKNTKDFEKWNYEMKDAGFLKLMNDTPNSQVALYARTYEKGYSCDVRSCKIEVIFRSFDSDFEKYELF